MQPTTESPTIMQPTTESPTIMQPTSESPTIILQRWDIASPKSTLSTRIFELNKQLQRYTPHLNTANVLFSVLLAECNSILHDTRLEINAENKRPGWYLADLEVLVVMSEKAKYHVDMLDKRVQSLRCELNFVKSLITKLQWREKNPTTPHENGAHRDKLKQRLKRVHFDPDVIMNHGKSKRVARQKPNTTISIDRQGATRIRCGAAATSPPDRACCGALLTSSTSPPLPATPPLGSRGQQQAEAAATLLRSHNARPSESRESLLTKEMVPPKRLLRSSAELEHELDQYNKQLRTLHGLSSDTTRGQQICGRSHRNADGNHRNYHHVLPDTGDHWEYLLANHLLQFECPMRQNPLDDS